jgi:hypothetical protein
VLAQIPDLDQKPSPLSSVKGLDGRVISQALSLKLVFGMGLGLIVGAILPLLFGRGGAPKPVQELPAWTNVKNSEPSNSSAVLSQAPPWQPPAGQANAAVPPPASPDTSLPPPPADGYRPAVLNRRTWTPPQGAGAPPSATPPAGNLSPDYAGGNPPRASDRDFARPADRYEQQADRRNDPAARYGNPSGSDYRGNPVNGPTVRRDLPPPAPAGDDRYNYPADRSAPRQYAPATPSVNNGAAYDYRNQPQPPLDGESGVARFEGTISAPPSRTNP